MKSLFITALLISAAAVPAHADPVKYMFTGTFSGVNGGPFSGVDATFTGTADTNSLVYNGFSYSTALTSLVAVTANVGTFVITDPSYFYINTGGYAGLEFGAFDDSSYFSGQNDALIGYKGNTSFAQTPIAYFDGINATFNTDRGSVTITSATNGTFAANVAAVPEPATWAMMLVGFGMIGFGMRARRSKQTVRVAYA